MNTSDTLAVTNRSVSDVRNINEESLVSFYQSVALYYDVERVLRLIECNDLTRQTLRHVVVVFTGWIIVLRCSVRGSNIECNSGRRRGKRRVDRESKSRCAVVSFSCRYIRNAKRWAVIVLDCAESLVVYDEGAGNI